MNESFFHCHIVLVRSISHIGPGQSQTVGDQEPKINRFLETLPSTLKFKSKVPRTVLSRVELNTLSVDR